MLVIQEVADRTVVLHSLRAQILSRSAPVAGIRLRDSGCGGYVQTSYLKIGLDHDSPPAIVRDPITTATSKPSPFPPAFPATVKENDPALLSIQLDLSAGQAEFVLLLDWTWGNERKQTKIDNQGKPIIVSAFQQTTKMCSIGDEWYTPVADSACG